MFIENKKLLKFVCLVLGGVILPSISALAKLSVAPQYILFDKGMPRVQTVSVINNSDKEKTYNVKLLHYKQVKDGSYVSVDKEEENNKFADSLLFFGPRRFTLAPRGIQTIKIQRKPKADLETGEYRSHILFQEAEDEKVATTEASTTVKGLSFTITALYGVSIPVVVRNGELYSEVKIQNAKHVKNGENNLINVDIARSGNKSLRGDVLVKYQNKQIGLLKGVNVFLSIDKRNISIPLSLGEFKESDLEGKTLSIEYVVDGKALDLAEVVY